MWGFLSICWVLSLIWRWNLTINKKQIAPSWNQTHFGRIVPGPSMTCSHAFIVASENHFQSGIAPSQLAPETWSQINHRLIYLLAHLRHVEPISVSGTLSNEPTQTDYESGYPSRTELLPHIWIFLDVKLLLPFCNVYLFVRSPQNFWLVHLLISLEMLTFISLFQINWNIKGKIIMLSYWKHMGHISSFPFCLVCLIFACHLN